MHRIIASVATGIALVLTIGTAQAEIVSELSVGSGYRANLFNDSNAIGDTYAAAGLRLKYYPSAAVELAAGARYNAYVEYRDLSNFTGEASITAIPTPAASRVTLALSGSAGFRSFGPLYEPYNQAHAAVSTLLGYRLTNTLRLQGGAAFTNTEYTNSDYGSNRSLDFSGGINVTVFGSNGVALRADYARRWFDQPLVSAGGMMTNGTETETFEIAGLTARYSRPLGARTGLSFSGGYRQLNVGADYAALGYTIDYLSPWSDLWEGHSVSATLKHIFPKQVKLELAVAWYDKQFVDVIELDENQQTTITRDSRDDNLFTSSATIARPILLRTGRLLTPTVSIGYRQNRSSADYYDYNDMWGALSFNVTF